MKLTKNLLPLFLLFGLTATAQKAEYTYVTDKAFSQPAELYGYTLLPNEWENPSGDHGKIVQGEVSFGIFRGYLVVKGIEEAGSYSISRMAKEGKNLIRITTLDPADPSKQGSLKVILDDKKNIDAYIFRASQNHDEIIYYQAGRSAQEKLKNETYFTDKNELIIEDDMQIWGNTIRPFFELNRKGSYRIYASDNVSIEFVEEIEIKEQAVSEAMLARKAKREQKQEAKAKQQEATAALFEDDLDELEDDETDADFGFFQKEENNDSDLEILETASPEAAPDEAQPQAVKVKEKKVKAPKEKRTYKIVYTYIDKQYGAKRQTLNVKKWNRLTSQHSGDKEGRYVIEFATSAGDLKVYLNESNAVSSIDIADSRYLMRGY